MPEYWNWTRQGKLCELVMKWWWWWWLVRNQGLATKWAFPYVWNWTESLSSRRTLLLQQNQSQLQVFPWNHFSLAVTRVGSGNQQWQIATRKVNKRGNARSIKVNTRQCKVDTRAMQGQGQCQGQDQVREFLGCCSCCFSFSSSGFVWLVSFVSRQPTLQVIQTYECSMFKTRW